MQYYIHKLYFQNKTVYLISYLYLHLDAGKLFQTMVLILWIRQQWRNQTAYEIFCIENLCGLQYSTLSNFIGIFWFLQGFVCKTTKTERSFVKRQMSVCVSMLLLCSFGSLSGKIHCSFLLGLGFLEMGCTAYRLW